MKKAGMIFNKPVYLGLQILEISTVLMYEFWYNYVKPKYSKKAKLCCINTESFIVYLKTDNSDTDIAKDFETRFDTSNYELDRSLLQGKDKKVIRFMKDKFVRKIMTKFVRLRAKITSN